jgi:hypothetical protein
LQSQLHLVVVEQFWRAYTMTEPDVLEHNLQALKESQRAAWRKLADPLVTPAERRELRNQMKQSSADLRHCLEMTSERERFQARAVADIAGGFGKANFGFTANSR